MTSNPPQPEPEWPSSGPASSGPLDALPAAEDGLGAPDGRWHTGPQVPWPGEPQGDGWPVGRRWPPTRAPWPGAAADGAAAVLDRQTGEQPAARPPEPAVLPAAGEDRVATLGYLSVPFLGPLVPLAVYLFKRRASAYVRQQSAQALNLSITALLYTFCALILGAMLALDSVTIALIVVLPLAVALWIVTLAYVVMAASRASRGSYYKIPAWLCATILR